MAFGAVEEGDGKSGLKPSSEEEGGLRTEAQPVGRPAEPWEAYARAWDLLGSPFRPVSEDVARMERAWRNSLGTAEASGSIRILMLGVTPELATYRWAPDFHLTALDASGAMIRNVWPGDTSQRRAVEGNWLEIPFPDAAFDLVLTDCGLTALGEPGMIEQLGSELRRVLRPHGRFVFRHLGQERSVDGLEGSPVRRELVGVGGFHPFKLRFLLDLDAESGRGGVWLREAWSRFHSEFPDREVLAGALGVTREVVDTIDAYRGRDVRYVFPTRAELAERLPMFELRPGPAGGYPMADACPVFVGIPRP